MRYQVALAFTVLSSTIGGAAMAQEVTLSTTDESVIVSGTLQPFEGETYVLDTVIGTLSFNVEAVTCVGAACPVIVPKTPEIVISGGKDISTDFVSGLLAGFAQSKSFDMARDETAAPAPYVLTDTDGKDLARMTIQATNTSAGLISLLTTSSDMAVAARPASAGELDAFDSTGLGKLTDPSQSAVIGLDGVIVATAPNNPVQSISLADAARVFSGEVTNWAALGGPDADIRLYVPESGSGLIEIFDKLVMLPAQAEMNPAAQVAKTEAELVGLVAQDVQGIGLTSFAYASAIKALPLIDDCKMTVSPSRYTIQTEQYPLTRRIYAYTAQPIGDDAPLGGFLDFLGSDAGQQAVEDSGLVGQQIARHSIADVGLRFASAIISSGDDDLPALRSLVGELLVSQPLSTAFRFLTGTSSLDSRALADVERIAAYLDGYDGSETVVRLIGFTDTFGAADLNSELSARRAAQVRDALLAAAPSLTDKYDLRVLGFGEISPVACNETARGRQINRRVEIWIGDAQSVASR